MRKKTIIFLYPLGLILGVTGQILLKNYSHLNIALVFGESIMSLAGGTLIIIFWIGALINSAKVGRWGWFIFLFFLSIFALIVYIFAGPDPAQRTSESSSTSS